MKSKKKKEKKSKKKKEKKKKAKKEKKSAEDGDGSSDSSGVTKLDFFDSSWPHCPWTLLHQLKELYANLI